MMLATDRYVGNNDSMTVWEELIELATTVRDAADRAGAVSRVRANDIQLTAVRESAEALNQRVHELAAAAGAESST
jgi:hypothetical protein